ncbi:ATP-binding protein [Aquiflexum sp.]|uniref:ATP-binding protein n=1 Tax=Aquiflexum sp. TaxID=1872584 RepID=UPI0035945A95
MHGEIQNIISYLQTVTSLRLTCHFEEKPFSLPDFEILGDSPLSVFLKHYNLNKEEVILLSSALVPHIIPGFFDKIIEAFLLKGGNFPEFGGIKGDNQRGMLPTGETVLFIVAGTDLTERLKHLPLFDKSNQLFKHHILRLTQVKTGEPYLSGKLLIEAEFVEVFTTGKVSLPSLSIDFPAEHLQSQLVWEDLVLPDQVWSQIKDLQIWLKHKDTLHRDWNLGRKLKPGYRALFYGPPGTGKTITATLLGKYTQKEVFRIDLSMVVSKYIGETEKNLATLFDKAENKDWILFFDEADAIFGKRTGVRDAHDKYANQEVSYLLQRIESYNGLVILASNFRSNIDAAFVRRFNAIIYFPPPKVEDRLLLWEKSLPQLISLGKDLELREIAERYELNGSHIMNIVQYISLVSLESRNFILTKDLMIKGIKRELEKEGK